MIILKYPKKTALTETWREKLAELAIGFKIEEDAELKEAMISEKEEIFVGDAAVSDFVIKLEKFVHAWRDPKCGV